MKTIDAAQGLWPEILSHLGVEQRYLSGKHTDCPLCGQGKDTFRFDDKDGSGSYYCGKCESGYGIHFVMKYLNLSFPDAAKRVDELIGNAEPLKKPIRQERDPRPLLQRIAKRAMPLNGSDNASRYLRNRGLSVTSKALQFHSGLMYWDRDDSGKPVALGKYPAMVALVADPQGEPLTYHVTYLADDQKASIPSPKKLMTPLRPLQGAAIRLFPAAEYLAVAEGIETALAVHQKLSVPVWATITANGMEALILPDEVRELGIYADNDASYTGQAAAYSLAKRYRNKGLEVSVHIPDKVGCDFLDQWRQL